METVIIGIIVAAASVYLGYNFVAPILNARAEHKQCASDCGCERVSAGAGEPVAVRVRVKP